MSRCAPFKDLILAAVGAAAAVGFVVLYMAITMNPVGRKKKRRREAAKPGMATQSGLCGSPTCRSVHSLQSSSLPFVSIHCSVKCIHL